MHTHVHAHLMRIHSHTQMHTRISNILIHMSICNIYPYLHAYPFINTNFPVCSLDPRAIYIYSSKRHTFHKRRRSCQQEDANLTHVPFHK